MKYVYKLVVILGVFMLFSCSEEALPSKSLHATNETVTTSQLQLYPEVSEIIDYYTVLYEQGDILELSLHQKKVETKYVQETTHKPLPKSMISRQQVSLNLHVGVPNSWKLVMCLQ